VAVMQGGCQRYVRHVAPAIGRYARSALPSGLGIVGARAAAARPETISAIAATFVPDRLRNVAQRGRPVRGIAGRPILAWVGSLVEFGAAHAHAIGRGTKAVDRQAAGGLRFRTTVATRRAAIARGDQGRDALRRRLLPEVVVKGVIRGSHVRFAASEAGAHDRRQVV